VERVVPNALIEFQRSERLRLNALAARPSSTEGTEQMEDSKGAEEWGGTGVTGMTTDGDERRQRGAQIEQCPAFFKAGSQL